MNYYTIPPPASLADHVRFFWVLESDASYTHHGMADGCAEMIFHYNGVFDEWLPDGRIGSSAISGIQGPSQYYRRFRTNRSFGMFGVYLYPFATQQLFSVPAAALANQMPCLKTFLGNEGAELEERMLLATDNTQRVKIITRFLENRLLQSNTTQSPIYHVIRNILKAKDTGRIHEVAAQCFLSTRQFERKFKELSGFSPKLYTRIIRFQKATLNYSVNNKSLTDIAYSCGYYDQSHFISDFKEFSGLHPKAYFSGATEATAWRDA